MATSLAANPCVNLALACGWSLRSISASRCRCSRCARSRRRCQRFGGWWQRPGRGRWHPRCRPRRETEPRKTVGQRCWPTQVSVLGRTHGPRLQGQTVDRPLTPLVPSTKARVRSRNSRSATRCLGCGRRSPRRIVGLDRARVNRRRRREKGKGEDGRETGQGATSRCKRR